MNRVALTGGSGFLGHHVAARFRDAGWAVRCLVRPSSDTVALRALGVQLAEAPLTAGTPLAAAVEGADVVVHCAGAIAARSERAFLLSNRDAAVAVAEAAAAAAVSRLVLISSIAAHGPSQDGGDGRDRPISAYGRSKRAGEEVIAAALAGRVPLAILRPPPIYGPRDHGMLPVFRMARRGLLPTFGTAPRRFSIVHVRDAADAVYRLAVTATPPGPYYPEDGSRPTWPEFAAHLALAVGRPVRSLPLPAALMWTAGAAASAWGLVTRPRPFSLDKVREMAAPGWVFSARRLKADTGWVPENTLRDGLAETCRWYVENGWLRP